MKYLILNVITLIMILMLASILDSSCAFATNSITISPIEKNIAQIKTTLDELQSHMTTNLNLNQNSKTKALYQSDSESKSKSDSAVTIKYKLENKLHELLIQSNNNLSKANLNLVTVKIILNSVYYGNKANPSDEYNDILLGYYNIYPKIFKLALIQIDPHISHELKLMIAAK